MAQRAGARTSHRTALYAEELVSARDAMEIVFQLFIDPDLNSLSATVTGSENLSFLLGAETG